MTKNEIYGFLTLAHFQVEEGLVPCPTKSYKEDGLIITVSADQMQSFFLAQCMMNAHPHGQHLFRIGETWCRWKREGNNPSPFNRAAGRADC